MPVDLIIEAEDFSATTSPDPPLAWTLATDVPGYSGTGFMDLGPGSGAACVDTAAFDMCAASLVYDITIDAPATYYFHARMYATFSGEDSIWYGVDGAVAMPFVDCVEDSNWHWSSGGSHVLQPGAHTLTIWQRESGVRLDKLALTLAPVAPP
jgi:hypothetical protein